MQPTRARNQVGGNQKEDAQLDHAEELHSSYMTVRGSEEKREERRADIERQRDMHRPQVGPSSEVPALDEPECRGDGKGRVAPLRVFVQPWERWEPTPRQEGDSKEIESDY